MKPVKSIISILFFIAIGVFISPINIYASDATVVFGSDSYENESGAEFPVGVYIDGDSEIGYYSVEIEYDPARLEYVSGATSGGDGTVTFEGNGNDTRVSTMLTFRALSGGETKLTVSEARVRVAGTDGELFDMTELATVPIRLSGEDTVGTTTTADAQEGGDNLENPDETQEGEAQSEEQKDEAKPSSQNGSLVQPLVVSCILAGILGAIIAILLARRASRKKKKRKEYAQIYNRKFGNGKSQDSTVTSKAAVKPDVKATPPKEVSAKEAPKKEIPKKEIPQNEVPKKEISKEEVSAKHETKPPVTPVKAPVKKEETKAAPVQTASKGEPVIQVKNVGMTFKVTNSTASGFKDYIIQKAKGNMKSRKLEALKDISFDVYKGEVVGIIGTNGSGKSTLLKIVSGALSPTTGEVIADKQKIQLLTLGTGFDVELSARENVYLNGAIIGYTKEFIDEHYDEIVEFAELQDFMEEKVKNFSSGMVSRLGFSIATVAGAAEILILDEVLSVGDQFFRKKSLERVQQMIHGGSTVLIVSHSIGTIKAHCTKVVWIEKGKLQMVGDPKTVCEAYENQQNDVKLNSEGQLAYYKGDEFQKNYTGLVKNKSGDWIMVKNGIQDKSYTYAKMVDKVLKYFDKGIVNNKYTGIAKTETGMKAYFKDGIFQINYTGLVKTGENEYIYLKKGIFDNKFSGNVNGYDVIDGVATKNN